MVVGPLRRPLRLGRQAVDRAHLPEAHLLGAVTRGGEVVVRERDARPLPPQRHEAPRRLRARALVAAVVGGRWRRAEGLRRGRWLLEAWRHEGQVQLGSGDLEARPVRTHRTSTAASAVAAARPSTLSTRGDGGGDRLERRGGAGARRLHELRGELLRGGPAAPEGIGGEGAGQPLREGQQREARAEEDVAEDVVGLLGAALHRVHVERHVGARPREDARPRHVVLEARRHDEQQPQLEARSHLGRLRSLLRSLLGRLLARHGRERAHELGEPLGVGHVLVVAHDRVPPERALHLDVEGRGRQLAGPDRVRRDDRRAQLLKRSEERRLAPPRRQCQRRDHRHGAHLDDGRRRGRGCGHGRRRQRRRAGTAAALLFALGGGAEALKEGGPALLGGVEQHAAVHVRVGRPERGAAFEHLAQLGLGVRRRRGDHHDEGRRAHREDLVVGRPGQLHVAARHGAAHAFCFSFVVRRGAALFERVGQRRPAQVEQQQPKGAQRRERGRHLLARAPLARQVRLEKLEIGATLEPRELGRREVADFCGPASKHGREPLPLLGRQLPVGLAAALEQRRQQVAHAEGAHQVVEALELADGEHPDRQHLATTAAAELTAAIAIAAAAAAAAAAQGVAQRAGRRGVELHDHPSEEWRHPGGGHVQRPREEDLVVMHVHLQAAEARS
eukprot:scaffold107070_cov72-Phaeocystis_antarctica.AAC.12